MDTTFEITKVVLPALVSSGIIAYFFNKRLKRLSSYQAITDELFKRMLQGMEEILKEANSIREALSSLNEAVSMSTTSPHFIEEVRAGQEKFGEAIQNFRRVVDHHRMYITPLMPYGKSHEYYDCFASLNGCIDGIEHAVENDDIGRIHEWQSRFKANFERGVELHNKLRIQIDSIIKDINDGRNIF